MIRFERKRSYSEFRLLFWLAKKTVPFIFRCRCSTTPHYSIVCKAGRSLCFCSKELGLLLAEQIDGENGHSKIVCRLLARKIKGLNLPDGMTNEDRTILG